MDRPCNVQFLRRTSDKDSLSHPARHSSKPRLSTALESSLTLRDPLFSTRCRPALMHLTPDFRARFTLSLIIWRNIPSSVGRTAFPPVLIPLPARPLAKMSFTESSVLVVIAETNIAHEGERAFTHAKVSLNENIGWLSPMEAQFGTSETRSCVADRGDRKFLKAKRGAAPNRAGK
jgi:hypothetical protein